MPALRRTLRPTHLLAILCVVLYANFVLAVARFQPNVMFMDQWDYLVPLFNGDGLGARFLQQQGPVREGLGLVATGWILDATRWDVRYDSIFGATLALVATVLALRLKKKMTGALAFSDAWIPVMFLSLGQFETVVSVPNASHSVLPLALILLSANVWLSARPGLRYLVGSVIGIGLIFTGFGLFAGAVIGVLLGGRVIRHARRREYPAAALAAVGLAAIIAGWVRFSDGYTFQPAVEGYRFPWTPLTDYVSFVTLMMNLPTAHIGESSRHYLLGALLALVLTVTAASIAWRWLKHNATLNDDVLTLLMGSSMLFVVMTAVGRIPLGVLGGTASRYLSLMLPAWLAVYLAAALYSRTSAEGPLRSPRMLPLATLVVGLVALAPYTSMHRRPLTEWPGTLGTMDWQHDVMVFLGVNKVMWADRYLATGDWASAQASVLQPIHPSPAGSRFDDKLRFLREHDLSFFSSDRRGYLPWLADDRFICPASGSNPRGCR